MLLVVDEIGYLPVSQNDTVALLQLINAQHERTSTVLTSNVSVPFPGDGGAHAQANHRKCLSYPRSGPFHPPAPERLPSNMGFKELGNPFHDMGKNVVNALS